MCTSVVIGFYIRNESEFQEFRKRMGGLSQGMDSVFSVYERKPTGRDENLMEEEDEFCIV